MCVLKRVRDVITRLGDRFYFSPAQDVFSDFENFEFLENEGVYKASIKTAEDALCFLKILGKINPQKLFLISLVYELRGGSSLVLKKDGIYRTLFISNASDVAYRDLEKFVKERGEIYHPENPFNLSFVSIKIKVSELRSRPSGVRSSKSSCFSSSLSFFYKLVPVRSVFEAVFFKKRGKVLGRKECPNFPLKVKEKGIKTLTALSKLSINEQINLLSGAGRKGSMFSTQIELMKSSDLVKIEREDAEKKALLTYDKELKLVIPASLSSLNLAQREIQERKLESLKDTIIISFDCEWNWEGDEKSWLEVSDPDFLSYCVVYGRSWALSNDYNYEAHSGWFGEGAMEKFIGFCLSIAKKYEKSKVYCVAHNASKIENILVVNSLAKKLGVEYSNYEIRFSHVTGTNIHSFVWSRLTFIDSNKFFQGPLSKLCTDLNQKHFKLEMTKEEILSENWKNPSEKGLKYAIMDSVALAEMWMRGNQMLNELLCTESERRAFGYVNFSSFKSGSSVVKWFLTKDSAKNNDGSDYVPKKGRLGWDSEEASDLRDVIFHGGRTECFYIGTSDQYKKNKKGSLAYAIKIDRTSSYPAEMAKSPMPGKVIKVQKASNLKELGEILENEKELINLAHCKIKLKKRMKLPLLGMKHGGKLVFPNLVFGDVAVPAWDFELKELWNNIEQVSDCEVVSFEKSYEICPKIKVLYEMREKALASNNKAAAFVLKILMNSSYGSMALNPVRETAYLAKGTKVEQLAVKHSESTVMDGPCGFKWIITRNKEKVNSLIFIASYITAKARYALWKEGDRLLREEGASLLMCDTDSHMFADKKEKLSYYEKRYEEKGLGRWKLEGHADSWEIAALKVYRFGNEIRFKGVYGENEKLLKNGQLANEVEIEVWSKGRDGKIKVEKQLKKMSFKYEKGTPSITNPGFVEPYDF